MIPKFRLRLLNLFRAGMWVVCSATGLLGACQSGPTAAPATPSWVLDAYTLGTPESPAPELPDALVPAQWGGTSSVAPDFPSSGQGGTLPVEPGFTVGAVWGLDTVPPRPIAQATVRTTDGREATTDTQGFFRLTGSPPSDGVYLATAAGYVASAIAGYDDTGPQLHLKPRTSVFPAPTSAGLRAMRIRGQCVDDTGSPLAGLILVLGLGAGDGPPPVTTNANGEFTFQLQAREGRLENAALLAVDPNQTWLGALTDLHVSGDDIWLDAEPSDEATAAWTLQQANHRLQVLVDRGNVIGRTTSSVAMVAPNGTALGLVGDAQNARVVRLPGIRWALNAEISDAQGTTRSRLYRPDLSLRSDSDHTVVFESLLPVPAEMTAPWLAPGQPLRWAAAPGASSYKLEIAAVGATPPFHWEAFTPLTSLPLQAVPAPLPAGEYQAVLTAWDIPHLTPRSLAQAPVRRLRSPTPTQGYRESSRRVRLDVP